MQARKGISPSARLAWISVEHPEVNGRYPGFTTRFPRLSSLKTSVWKCILKGVGHLVASMEDVQDAPTKIHCERCDRWLDVRREGDQVRCECGRRFIVTVTELPTRLA